MQKQVRYGEHTPQKNKKAPNRKRFTSQQIKEREETINWLDNHNKKLEPKVKAKRKYNMTKRYLKIPPESEELSIAIKTTEMDRLLANLKSAEEQLSATREAVNDHKEFLQREINKC